jgi:hypothetical protein
MMWFNLVALLYIQILLLVYDKLPIYTMSSFTVIGTEPRFRLIESRFRLI